MPSVSFKDHKTFLVDSEREADISPDLYLLTCTLIVTYK